MSRRRYFEEQRSGNGAIYHCVKTEIEPGDRIKLFNLMNKIKSDTISQDKINSVLNQPRTPTNTGVYDKLFSEFHSFMESKGLQFNEGRIIDASFVIAPRQRNTRDENEQIKQGAGDKLWNDNPHKKCHKDVDARWTKKRDETFYGYKQHTKVEKRNKIILSYDTTSAEVHDSKGFEGLLDEKDEGKDLYLDAGYVGQEEIVKQHKMNPIICEKGYRNRPLTKEQKSDNRKKSKTRCLVEHVFGFEEQTMRGLVVRTVGLIRAKANVALTSLVYNISRYTQIIRLKPELLG